MMGDSAGRSARHRIGDGAARRYTQRERDLIDPAQLEHIDIADLVPGYVDPFARKRTAVDYVAAGVCILLVAMLIFLVIWSATSSA